MNVLLFESLLKARYRIQNREYAIRWKNLQICYDLKFYLDM